MTRSIVRIYIQNMFDPKFELDSRFGDAAPPPPKRKKRVGGKTSWGSIEGLKLTPAEKACLRPATTMYIHFCSHTF
jgi:hypothetical protein